MTLLKSFRKKEPLQPGIFTLYQRGEEKKESQYLKELTKHYPELQKDLMKQQETLKLASKTFFGNLKLKIHIVTKNLKPYLKILIYPLFIVIAILIYYFLNKNPITIQATETNIEHLLAYQQGWQTMWIMMICYIIFINIYVHIIKSRRLYLPTGIKGLP